MYRTDHIALALLCSPAGIVLVQQLDKATGQPYWVLPGGLVEAGELVVDGLRRELREEAGVTLAEIASLALVSQVVRPMYGAQTFAHVFAISAWEGSLVPEDPDGEVLTAALMPRDEALAHLATSPWRGIRDPLCAFIRGEIAPGSFWCYQQTEAGQELCWRSPAFPRGLD